MFHQVCYDYSSLQSALNISGSVSASFGFGSLDAKSSYMESLSVTNTSVTIVVYTNIVTEATTMIDVELINDPPTDIAAFCRAYGDSYLGQVTTGAEYAATYVFYSETVEQQKSIQATLQANGISSGGSLSTSLQTSLDTVTQQISTRQSLKQFMSGFTNPVFPPADQIIDFALNFGSKTPNASAVISYITSGYENVRNMPTSFSSVVATRSLYEGVGSQDGLADQYADLGAIKNAIAAIKTVYNTYGYTTDKQLTDREAVIDGDIATLDLLFQAMAADPTQIYTAPTLQGLTWGEPALNVVLSTKGPYGGNGGGTFQEVNESSVAISSVLSQFSARGGNHLDAITYTYNTDAGTYQYTHGGDGGGASNVFILQSAERVKTISGTWGKYMNSIKIVTSYNNTFAWPPDPNQNDRPFSWTASGSSVFLGFAGRAHTYVDQLSFVIATFQPANWTDYTLGKPEAEEISAGAIVEHKAPPRLTI